MPGRNVRGRMVYAPPEIINELEDLKAEEQIKSNARAFIKAVDYIKVGREVNRISHLKFKWSPTEYERMKNNKRGFSF